MGIPSDFFGDRFGFFVQLLKKEIGKNSSYRNQNSKLWIGQKGQHHIDRQHHSSLHGLHIEAVGIGHPLGLSAQGILYPAGIGSHEGFVLVMGQFVHIVQAQLGDKVLLHDDPVVLLHKLGDAFEGKEKEHAHQYRHQVKFQTEYRESLDQKGQVAQSFCTCGPIPYHLQHGDKHGESKAIQQAYQDT